MSSCISGHRTSLHYVSLVLLLSMDTLVLQKVFLISVSIKMSPRRFSMFGSCFNNVFYKILQFSIMIILFPPIFSSLQLLLWCASLFTLNFTALFFLLLLYNSMTKSNFGRKQFILPYSLYVHHCFKPEQELGSRDWSRYHERARHTFLLNHGFHSVFLQHSWLPHSGEALYTVIWFPLH